MPTTRTSPGGGCGSDADRLRTIAVFALLTAATLMLAAGVAIISPLLWIAGTTSYLAAFGADHALAVR